MGSVKDKKTENKIKKTVFTPETLGVVLCLFATLCLICLITRDAVFSYPGQCVNAFLFGCFGVFAYAVIALAVIIGVMLITGKKIGLSVKLKVFMTLFFLCVALLCHAVSVRGFSDSSYGDYLIKCYNVAAGGLSTATAGGLFTGILCYAFTAVLTNVGAYVILSVLTLVSGYFFVNEIIKKYKSFAAKNNRDEILISGERDYPVQNAFDGLSRDVEKQPKPAAERPVEYGQSVKKTEPVNLSSGEPVARETDASYSGARRTELEQKLDYILRPVSYEENKRFGRDFSGRVSGYVNGREERAVKDYSKTTVSGETVGDVDNKEYDNDVFGIADNTAAYAAEELGRQDQGDGKDEGNGVAVDDATSRAERYAEKYAHIRDEAFDFDNDSQQENTYREEKESPAAPSRATFDGGVEAEEVSYRPLNPDTNTGERIFRDAERFARTEQDPTPTNIDDLLSDRRRDRFDDFADEKTESEKTDLSNGDGGVSSDRVLGGGFSARRAEEIVQPTEPQKPVEQEKPKRPVHVEYVRPPLDLLEQHLNAKASEEDHEGRMETIRQTLEEFKINAEPQSYIQGPTITRYEIKMPAGISVKKVLSYDDDLRMRLESKSGVRIEAPIPGKNLVGIEVANKYSVTVGLREVMENMAKTPFKPGSLMFALGKDIVGDTKSDNLAKGPHFLVAGATGSGKSVCLNVMIMSLIMRYSPEDLRLILVDPKSVGFAIYKHLPHLMIDEIVTDPQRTIAVLAWAYKEMERRYKLFAESERVVFDIDAYNKNVADENTPKLPRIVIIVDELADLMETNKREMESKIRALAQKSRAAGIHLVLATQRPSVDIVTGTIKANLPSRIALKVMNFQDSNTILAEGGAEKLLGNGDMLYKNSAMNECERYQGAWVSDSEISSVVSYIIEHNQAYFDDELTDFLDNSTAAKQDEQNGDYDGEDGENDAEFSDLFIKALAFGIKTGTISISSLQRRFPIGYSKAGRLIDQMEKNRFITGNEGSKARRILLSREQFEEKFGSMDDMGDI